MNNVDTERGHYGVSWFNEHKFLPYVRPEISAYQKMQYDEAGYESNPSIHYNVEEYIEPIIPIWAQNVENLFGLYDQELRFVRINQFDVIPPYRISTTEYCRTYKADPDDLFNAILMLEDWQAGQLFEIDGVQYSNWKEGDWFKWQTNKTVSYANVGKKKMYMLQVIGKESFTGQLEHLFPLNVPNLYEKGETTHPFVQRAIIPHVDPHRDSTNYNMVYMHNGYISELDDVEHDQKGIDKINKYGIRIWLFEPMCQYYEGEEFTQGFYSEFNYPHDKHRMRSKELDSIKKYAIRNNIQPDKIKVMTGEYQIETEFPHYNNTHYPLVLECNDLYVHTQRPIVGLESFINEEYCQHKFSKHFISLNWRFTKHRQIIANFLAGENGYLSWYFSDSFDVVKDKLYFDIEAWQHSSPEVFKQLHDNTAICQQNSPYTVDKPSDIGINSEEEIWPSVAEYRDGQTPSLYNTKETLLGNIYKDIFVDIVTETRFAQPCANYSEKVLQPIQYMKPFILLAPPHALKYLKESGYQTFEQFWDESYDQIEDHGERLRKILELVKFILDKPIEELHTMYQQMMPVIEHNRQTFMSLTAVPNYDDTEFHN